MAGYGSSNQIGIPGLLAGANLAAKQYYWVKCASTAGEVVVVSATTDVALGILQNAPADGEPAEVVSHGVSKLVCGSTAVTFGSAVGWNAEGQGNSRTNNGSRFSAIAIEASATDGDIIAVSLQGFSRGA